VAKTRDDARHAATGGAREYQYRGRSIVIQETGDLRRGDDMREVAGATDVRVQPKLAIDGRDVPVEKSEGGYLSHDFMFKEFGTLDELAEELIRQWGSAKIEPGGQPHDHDHGHS
jgi:hypothetical protein